MTLQGLTVALSESGIEAFAKDLVADQIASQLAKLAPPDSTIPVPDFMTSDYAGGYFCYSDIVIKLTSGRLDGFKASFKSIAQQADGVFQLTMAVAPFTVDYRWKESYQFGDQKYGAAGCSDFTPEGGEMAYSIQFDHLVITIDLQLSYGDSRWKLEVVQVTTDPGNPDPSIPPNSVLNKEENPACANSHISQKTKAAVETIDFRAPILKILDSLANSIPSTGHLTPDITFEFGTGPSGLSFPGDKGLQVGVTGQVTYQGKAFPGGSPPQLPLPDLPKEKQLAYYAAAYEFDSLFWAFYQQGMLKELVTPGDLPDPSALYTNSYKGGPLQGLPQKYPNLTMSAAISATAAPTVSFQTVYYLSTSVLADLKKTLPAEIYGKLSGLANQYFLDEASFYTGLVNVLGESAATQWKATIETAAQGTTSVVGHQSQVILNVLQGGNPIPVLTFSVAQKDVLSNLALGISASGKTQTLQFGFQIVPTSVETKLLSTTIPSITTNDFGFVWSLVLEPVYAKEVAKMGQQGIALPRIPNFDFLFKEAQISIESADGGYVSILTDFEEKTAS